MFTICLNTIKWFVRNKLVYIILATAIWLIFFSLVLQWLTINQWAKVIVDFSLTIIEVFGLITTLFLGSYLIYKEINQNTILLVLSKNPSRGKFIIWKFLWFAFLIGLLYVVLSLAFLVVLYVYNIWFQWAFISAIFLSYIKILITLSFIVFFSTFVSPFLALLVSIWLYLVAHMTSFLRFYVLRLFDHGGIYEFFVELIYFVIPNFQNLSMKEYLLSPHLGEYTIYHIGLSSLVGVIYIAFLLGFSIFIFKRKQF